VTTVTARLIRAQEWAGQRRPWLLALLLVVALAWPFVIRPYYLSLTIDILIFTIFAMSLDLLLGYTGLPSFGHAAFFGLGGYLVAYIAGSNAPALGLTSNLFLTVPFVMLVTALVALGVGFFVLRTSDIYFLMITLAFAQMLFSIAIRWSGVTGGSDGLAGVERPAIGFGPLTYHFISRESFYFLTVMLFLAAYWTLRRIVNSPFGWTLRGIRENEQRMRALGYATFRHKMAAFAIAGAFAGLAGMLLVHSLRQAAPEYLYWTTSGEVMIMLIVGGAGTLTGPLIGATIVRLFPLLISSYVDRWQTLEGFVFVAFVLFAPRGLIGLWHQLRNDALAARIGNPRHKSEDTL
jgi:branched-chain amino acid transport system permease protein